MARQPLFILCIALLAACAQQDPPMPPPGVMVSLAEQGEHGRVLELLRAGASPDVVDACRWTPLMKAALNGHLETVERLLLFGADVQAMDKGGYTALMLAASNDHVEVVRRLLDAGAHIDQRETTQGWTALIWSTKRGHHRTVALLRERGADASIVGFDGRSAAQWSGVEAVSSR